jgi:hypothetical protein
MNIIAMKNVMFKNKKGKRACLGSATTEILWIRRVIVTIGRSIVLIVGLKIVLVVFRVFK